MNEPSQNATFMENTSTYNDKIELAGVVSSAFPLRSEQTLAQFRAYIRKTERALLKFFAKVRKRLNGLHSEKV